MKRLFQILFFVLLIFTCFIVKINVKADNGSTSRTYTVDANNEMIPTQDAYIAVKNINTFDITNSDIDTTAKPEDIYYQEDLHKFYVADTGNKRILVLEPGFETGIEVGKGILNTPQGVFTNKDGDIYVADYGLKQVVIFRNGNYDNPEFIGKPTHPVYQESSSEFLPSKIVVDAVGTMYIIDSGNANGIVTITSDNEFSGYFGANYVQPTFSFVLKFLFSTKEQRKKLYVSPISPVNLAIDDDGLINTISNIEGQVLKKLNIAGTNLFPTNMKDWGSVKDLAISVTGTIYVVNAYGYVMEYDQEGNLLFDFGGSDSTGTYLGLFNAPTAIETDSEYNLYVLDGNSIQVFTETEFASIVHTALDLYQDGKYQESRSYWEQVLTMNNMFDLAHKGLGNAYLREMMYEEAIYEFKLAKDAESYSDAYWEVRNAWLKSTGYIVLIAVIIIVVILIILNKLHLFDGIKNILRGLKEKIFKVKIIKEVCYIGKFITHPLNSFYEIKHHNTMSVASATILYIYFFILMLLASYFTGFAFNTTDKEAISLLNVGITSVIPLLLFVICNYLIVSITEGNAKLKDVYIGTICSFAPMLLLFPFVIILSNFLTTSESFLYTMPKMVLYGWSFVLMFFMIKDLNELQFGENIKNIIITILTMVLFIAFGFLLYMLSNHLISFISDVIKEVVANG